LIFSDILLIFVYYNEGKNVFTQSVRAFLPFIRRLGIADI